MPDDCPMDPADAQRTPETKSPAIPGAAASGGRHNVFSCGRYDVGMLSGLLMTLLTATSET